MSPLKKRSNLIWKSVQTNTFRKKELKLLHFFIIPALPVIYKHCVCCSYRRCDVWYGAAAQGKLSEDQDSTAGEHHPE